MSRSGEERVVAEVPSGLKLVLDEDDRTNKEIIIQALETELGVAADDSKAVLKRKLRRKESRLREHKEDLEEQRSRIEREEKSAERIREVLETKEERESDYTGKLDSILDQLEANNGRRILAFKSEVGAAATDGRSRDEVRYDLKARAAEQERDINHTQFMEGGLAEDPDPQPIAEVWDEEGGDR